jgi:hypothetical protein
VAKYATEPTAGLYIKVLGSNLSGAIFSDCKQYRYAMWRFWGGNPENVIAFIGLNPSTADHLDLDPTTTRLRNFAQEWGYDGFYMLNLFGIRATDPKVMLAHADPIGRETDRYIKFYSRLSKQTVCCWGNDGKHLKRDQAVLTLLEKQPLYAFKITATGQPWHPLYLPGDSKPFLWKEKTNDTEF